MGEEVGFRVFFFGLGGVAVLALLTLAEFDTLYAVGEAFAVFL